MSTCPHCGAGLLPGVEAGVCPECGKSLSGSEARSTLPMENGAETPTRIGPFKLLELIGEGGMGRVYLAEQQEPVRRKVALKLIKLGMDTEQVVARFESERQALALMDHPAIAKVFDGGATGDGRPYFAMEYVKGVPITTYCDTHKLGMRARLDLFLQVCEGVQHAHQKGIIHRDLKPSNVLVAIQEDRPVPKIIDFGVAKAVNQRLTERTMFTQMGMLIGTPEYMSPEQAEMTGLDVDTRTDVYSLGVLLYELLSGSLPFTSQELREAGFDAFRRMIRDEDPPKPSTRASRLGADTETVAAARGLHSRDLVRRLQGDLDWITVRSMEKDRTRRYGSPMDLAADIRRYLTDEPVVARPPSAAYRTRKFVKRHRVGVTAGALVVLAVILGMVGTTVGLVRARAAERVATREATAANAVSNFLVGLFQQANPWEAQTDSMQVREVLDRGAKRIESELADQPLLEARMMDAIADAYEGLRLDDRVTPLREKVLSIREQHLEPGDALIGRSLVDLAGARGPGSRAEAYAMADSGLAILREALPANDPDLARALQNTGNLYAHWTNGNWHDLQMGQPYLREALAVADASGDLELAASIRGDLSWFLSQSVRIPLKMTPHSRSVAWKEAESLLLKAIQDRESLGKDTLPLQMRLAERYFYSADPDDPLPREERVKKGLSLYLSLLDGIESIVGSEHRALLPVLTCIVSCYDVLGDQETALQYAEKMHTTLVSLEDADSTEIAQSWLRQAGLHARNGDLDAAVPLFERSIRFFGWNGDPKKGPIFWGPQFVQNGGLEGPKSKAKDCYAMAQLLERVGYHRSATLWKARAAGSTATWHEQNGEEEEALRYAKQRLDILSRDGTPDSIEIADGIMWLAGYYAQTNLDKALPLFDQATHTLGWFDRPVEKRLQRYERLAAPSGFNEFRGHGDGLPEDLLVMAELLQRMGYEQDAAKFKETAERYLAMADNEQTSATATKSR